MVVYRQAGGEAPATTHHWQLARLQVGSSEPTRSSPWPDPSDSHAVGSYVDAVPGAAATCRVASYGTVDMAAQDGILAASLDATMASVACAYRGQKDAGQWLLAQPGDVQRQWVPITRVHTALRREWGA